MKPDQERVRSLLTDTVTLLCKNGLHFCKELKVEGVLGITLDDNDVFIVHINEKITEQCGLDMRYNNDCIVIPNTIANSSDFAMQQGVSFQGLTELTPAPKETRLIYTRSPSSFKRRRKEFPSKSKAYLSDYIPKDATLTLVKSEALPHSEDMSSQPQDETSVEKADRGNFPLKEEHLMSVKDAKTDAPVVEILSDLEVIKTDEMDDHTSLNSAVGLNLSVKDERAKNNNDVKVDLLHPNQKSYDEKNVDMHPVPESLDISDQNDSESFQAWFHGLVPPVDELESFPLNNNNNNHPKGKQTDGYISPSPIPQKVTNVPLVTDLISSSRMKKAYLSIGRNRPTYNLPLQDPSTSLVPCSSDPVIEQHQRFSSSSYDQMIVEAEMASLTSSGSVRRPRSSRYKPFICQVPGCHRMFFRGSELYRHQREKHGARHVRPRGASLTYL